ncbi:SH3 domain-containing protein [Pseudoxanthomonas suwonensis]|uniref:SH3 domain-containing protein n=1 Tax=Pseudoxanthomonas suwonensis TaxID=314722 RepID=UPI000463DE7B|nr:SH3 domain-containing protein [Pseudoxanthomonas suwonensis]
MKKMTTMVMALGLLAAPALASAADAWTREVVNLRSGPDIDYPVVVTLDRGVSLEVFGCIEEWTWCDVATGPYRGWISAGYLDYEYDGRPVRVSEYRTVLGLPIVTFMLGSYWDHHYRHHAWYVQRPYFERRHPLHVMPPHHRPPPRPVPPPRPHHVQSRPQPVPAHRPPPGPPRPPQAHAQPRPVHVANPGHGNARPSVPASRPATQGPSRPQHPSSSGPSRPLQAQVRPAQPPRAQAQPRQESRPQAQPAQRPQSRPEPGRQAQPPRAQQRDEGQARPQPQSRPPERKDVDRKPHSSGHKERPQPSRRDR